MIDIKLCLQWLNIKITDALTYIFADDGRRFYGDLDGKL